jgi:hypothetical protein
MNTQESAAAVMRAVLNEAIALGVAKRPPAHARLTSSPMLTALLKTGTSHIYADTADSEELYSLLEVREGEIFSEVDGNTVNQPLVPIGSLSRPIEC